MALITSAASGNFSAGATWTGGVVPTVGDEARASTGHTITIDVNTTCDEISNAGSGKFVLSAGVTLTANVTHKSTTATINCLEFSASSPAIANVVGTCTAASGTVANGRAVANLGTGTLNITGNCFAGQSTGNQAQAAWNNGTGVINITGNCTGGPGAGGVAARNESTGTINITGNCIAAASAAVLQNSTGTLLVVGTIEASEFAPGVSGTNRAQVTLLTGPFLTSPTFGVNPIGCNAWRWAVSLNTSTFIEVPTSDLLAKRNLVTADNVTGMPAEADVKDGVVYGPASELTGTFEQTVAPSANDIRDAVWGAATSSLTTAGSIGERLKNTATVASTGDQLASALTAP